MNINTDVERILYKILNVPALTNVTGGGVYRSQRPADSKTPDIVVTCISIGKGTRQRFAANVNVYAKDIISSISGNTSTFPDSAKLHQNVKAVVAFLEEADTDGGAFWTVSTSPFSEPVAGHHYINVRVEGFLYNH